MSDPSDTPDPAPAGESRPRPAPRPQPAGPPPAGTEAVGPAHTRPTVEPPVATPAEPALPPAMPPALHPAMPPTLPPAGEEYSATLVAPSQIAVSVGIGVVLAVILVGIRTSLWPLAIVVFVALSAAGAYLAGVSVTATRSYLEIGQGRRGGDPRYISNDEIALIAAEDLTWAQVFGIGLPRAVRRTRLTVRPGPTLSVELRTGEVIRVSTPEPERAIAALGRPVSGSA